MPIRSFSVRATLVTIAVAISPAAFSADGGETDPNIDKDVSLNQCQQSDKHLHEAEGAGCEVERFKAAYLKRKELENRLGEFGGGNLDQFPDRLRQLEQELDAARNSSEQADRTLQNAQRTTASNASTLQDYADEAREKLRTTQEKSEKAKALEAERQANDAELQVLKPACDRAAVAYAAHCASRGQCAVSSCKQHLNAGRQRFIDATDKYKRSGEKNGQCGGTGSTPDAEAAKVCESVAATHAALAADLKKLEADLQTTEANCKREDEMATMYCKKASDYVQELERAVRSADQPASTAIAAARSTLHEEQRDRPQEIRANISEVTAMKNNARTAAEDAAKVAGSTSAYGNMGTLWTTNAGFNGSNSTSGNSSASTGVGNTGTTKPASTPTNSNADTASRASDVGASNQTSASSDNTGTGSLSGVAAAATTGQQTASTIRTTTPSTAATTTPMVSPLPWYASDNSQQPAASGGREAAGVSGDATPAANAAATPAELNTPLPKNAEGGAPLGSIQSAGTSNGASARAGTETAQTASATSSLSAKTYSGTSGGGGRRYSGRAFIRRADGTMMTLEEYKDRLARGEQMPDVDLRQFLPKTEGGTRGVAGDDSAQTAALGGKYERLFNMINERYNSLDNPLDPDLPPPNK